MYCFQALFISSRRDATLPVSLWSSGSDGWGLLDSPYLINELNQTEYCSVCGFYDPHLDNDMDNDTENRKGRKRRRRDNRCRNCTKRRRAAAEPPCHMRRCNSHTRIHTSFVEHVCSDSQRSPSACGCTPTRCTSDLCRTLTTCSQQKMKLSLVRRKSLHQTGGAEVGAGADPQRHLAQRCP